MSTTGSATEPVRAARPAKPPPTAFAIVGTLIAITFTVVTAWDWEYGIGLSLAGFLEDVTRPNPGYEGLVNIDWLRLLSENPREGMIETVQMAVIATILGALAGLPLALLNSLAGAPNRVVFQSVRAFNTVVRSIPDILWAMIFVAAIGSGALPGTLALFLFSIGVVAKLTSDIVDGIDPGPLEAARASGASHFQMVRTAIVPQILPGYVSFSLYAFELNLRASAVLGFVGAGGIGQYMDMYRGRGQYDRVWGIVLGFFVVVFVVERMSMWLRRRIV